MKETEVHERQRGLTKREGSERKRQTIERESSMSERN